MLGSNREGEICVKSTMQLGGILNHDRVMDFDDEGWFHTGDVGYYDKKKLIYVVSRIKDVMKFSGHQVRNDIINL